jgi:ribose 5-phosphate isomerase A
VDPREDQKRAAAEAAAAQIEDGATVGLGTGSTVARFLPALARRSLALTCVATSPATEEAASSLGLTVRDFDMIERLDVAVDGADQVAPDLWLIKGGGGAHTREKVVAAATERFIVIVSSDKLVDALRPPVPVEVMRFGLRATLRRIEALGPVQRRDGPATPEGNVLADFLGPVDDPEALATALQAIPGVMGHGLFPPELVSEVLIGRNGGVVDRLN